MTSGLAPAVDEVCVEAGPQSGGAGGMHLGAPGAGGVSSASSGAGAGWGAPPAAAGWSRAVKLATVLLGI